MQYHNYTYVPYQGSFGPVMGQLNERADVATAVPSRCWHLTASKAAGAHYRKFLTYAVDSLYCEMRGLLRHCSISCPQQLVQRGTRKMRGHSSISGVLRACITLIVAFHFVGNTVADDWFTDNSGDFSDPANWGPVGVPGPDDEASFARGNVKYTVRFTDDIVISKLEVGTNEVTFAASANGGTLKVTGPSSPFGVGNVVIGAPGLAVLNSYVPMFSAGLITIGYPSFDSNSVGVLNINSGTINCTGVQVSNGGAGIVNVSGMNSTWNISGACYIGFNGQGSLRVANDGQVHSGDAFVGGLNGVADVSVSGPGSSWTAGQLLLDSPYSFVSGNSTIEITAGGSLNTTGGHLSGNTILANAFTSITVKGPGSRWNNNGPFSIGVGDHPENGELDILDGAHVTNALAAIYSYNYDRLTKVVVDGLGSVWENTASLKIGNSPANTEIDVTHGGTVTVATEAFILGDYNNSSAIPAIHVDGLNSSLTVGHTLQVGGNSGGALTITNGANVFDSIALVYPKVKNIPGTALVAGTDAKWVTSNDFILDGLLTVSDGGQVVVGGLMIIQ
jgi:T5SS/PEP-CTERM-associated repeat protein